MDLFDGPSTDRYHADDNEIGNGTFSEVYKATDTSTGNTVAIKCMHLTEDGQLPSHVQRELAALDALKHSNIISLSDHYQKKFDVSLVLEYCHNDLYTIIKHRESPVDPSITRAIMYQLLSAINACHSAGRLHRDIAPTNLLCNPQGIIKLADFGQCRLLSTDPTEPLTPIVGTRWYKAPELLFGSRHYTPAIDIWAAGCIFAELLQNEPLFPGNSDIHQICLVMGKLGTLDESVWPGVKDLPDWGKLAFPAKPAVPWNELVPSADEEALKLLASMMCYNPDERITAAEALNSPYFALDKASDQQVLDMFTTTSS